MAARKVGPLDLAQLWSLSDEHLAVIAAASLPIVGIQLFFSSSLASILGPRRLGP